MFVTLLVGIFNYLSNFSSRNDSYIKLARFHGLHGAINCLSFSHDGTLLAGGGDDKVVRIWDVSSRSSRHVLEDGGGRWGQITCLVWVTSQKDDLRHIAFGTSRGFLVIYCENRTKTAMVELESVRAFQPSDPVESIDYDTNASRLAVGSQHGNVSIYEVGKHGTMLRLWTVSVGLDHSPVIARSLAFSDFGGKILIFVLETGEMICRDVVSSKEDWRKILRTGLGHVACSSDGKLLLAHDLSQGFHLYPFPRSSPSMSYIIPTKRRTVKDGAFGEGSSAVICSSNHGKVYIFSTSTADPIQVLSQAGKTTDIQVVCTSSTKECHRIASATSTEISDVVIWEKRCNISGKRQKGTGCGAVVVLLNWAVCLALLYWFSGFWIPFAMKTTRSVLHAVKNTPHQQMSSASPPVEHSLNSHPGAEPKENNFITSGKKFVLRVRDEV